MKGTFNAQRRLQRGPDQKHGRPTHDKVRLRRQPRLAETPTLPLPKVPRYLQKQELAAAGILRSLQLQPARLEAAEQHPGPERALHLSRWSTWNKQQREQQWQER